MRGEISFTTVHGSRLYGLDHSGSDKDSMIVYNDSRRAVHKKSGGEDVIHVGIYDLIEKAQGGSHQFVEGIMSRKKIWHDEAWRPYIEELQIPAALIGEKYERTIKRLCFDESFKLRRHAVRLWMNLHTLRIGDTGRFNPELKYPLNVYAARIAEEYQGQALKEFLLS